ncbi:tRNA (N6-threonylcarbamoyladenosine(37)-N6)-methyltransferase TrmO [Bdellovibrionota bacterium FG-1]
MTHMATILKNPFDPIGTLKTCFTEKFGTPRQSMMIEEAKGVLKLKPNPEFRVALNHLEKFSHVWIIFTFHHHDEKGWRPTIRPPRTDAPRRVGVFASRSPHRPNPIGLSAVKLEKIDLDAPGGIEIHLGGVDLMDGTPVLDIKPYLPYADCFPHATAGWAEGDIPKYRVEFSPQSLSVMENASQAQYPRLQHLITEMLQWDPRPTSQRRAMPIEAPENQGKTFGFRILDFEIKWQIQNQGILVLLVV